MKSMVWRIKSKKNVFNKFECTKFQSDFIKFKKCRAQVRQIIKESKTNIWRADTSTITSKTNPKHKYGTKLKPSNASVSMKIHKSSKMIMVQ